jgi:hypothetical protein
MWEINDVLMRNKKNKIPINSILLIIVFTLYGFGFGWDGNKWHTIYYFLADTRCRKTFDLCTSTESDYFLTLGVYMGVYNKC